MNDPAMPDVFYDQKEVLYRTVKRHIKRRKARSLLDIGAGHGPLAIKLARLVQRYVAVEQDKSGARTIREAGLRVIAKHFPTPVAGRFDMVLVSHAIPERRNRYPRFLRECWEKVGDGGALLIITFKGGGGLNRLWSAVGIRNEAADRAMYETMTGTLKELGDMRITRATSAMRSRTVGAMLTVVAPALGIKAENAKRMSRLQSVLENQFKAGKIYKVPTEHVVITTVRRGLRRSEARRRMSKRKRVRPCSAPGSACGRRCPDIPCRRTP